MRAFTEHVGPHLPRALRRRRPEAAPLPLRRAGELARAHRGAAREQRAAHRARDARRDAVEATRGPARCSCRAGTRRSGLPRPWDQQWSLRMQQVLALRVRPARVRRPLRGLEGRRGARSTSCATAAWDELQWVLDGGGAFAMIDEIKGRLVQSHAERVRRIESGEIEGRRREHVHRDRAVAARRRALEGESRILDARPRGRARAGRGARGVARGARLGARSRPRSTRLQRVAAGRPRT